jgi:hypothetical protein
VNVGVEAGLVGDQCAVVGAHIERDVPCLYHKCRRVQIKRYRHGRIRALHASRIVGLLVDLKHSVIGYEIAVVRIARNIFHNKAYPIQLARN